MLDTKPGPSSLAAEYTPSELLYSNKVDLRMRDFTGNWVLQTDYPIQDVKQESKVQAAKFYSLAAVLITLLLTWRIAAMVRHYVQKNDSTEKHNIELERKVLAGDSALQYSEAKSSVILSNAADGIIILSDVGEILTFNKAAERAFGYRETDVIGLSIGSMIPDIKLDALA